MPHQRIVEAIERGRALARRGEALAVFDLDSTLFNTAPRNRKILQDFAQTSPGVAAVAARMALGDFGYTLVEDVRAAGLADAAALEALDAFWRGRFFTDDYVALDAPYPGALALVERVLEAGIAPYYLTGRDAPNMRRGTEQSLRAHGFPMAPPVTLRMKPRWQDDDRAFKEGVVEELRARGEVVLAFENEPGNANLFAEAFPEATVVLHETVCAPDPPPLHRRVVCVSHLEIEP